MTAAAPRAAGNGWAGVFAGVPAAAVALAGLFFMTGSLVVTLTPEGAAGSARVQALGVLFGAAGAVGLMARRGALNRVVQLYWPALLGPALAVASLLWSVEPDLTLRRAGALVLSTIFGLWLAERFSRRGLFALLVAAAGLTVAANLATVVLRPEVGLHQAFDALGDEAAHAGEWRGLFFHKNDFGRMMALCLTVFLVALVLRPGWRWVLLPAAAAALAGVLGSGSGQAVLLSVVLGAVIALAVRMRRASARGRAMAVVVAVPLAAFAALIWPLVFATVLHWLGKDATLTGRTEIWAGVLAALRGNLALGGGFGAGWDLVGDRLYALTAIAVGHAHNGYLDLMTDLGVLGLGLMLAVSLFVLRLSLRAWMQGLAPETGLLGLSVAVFLLLGNWAGSFLLLHNSLYWVLPVVLIVQLRRLYCPWGHRLPERPGSARLVFGRRRGAIEPGRQTVSPPSSSPPSSSLPPRLAPRPSAPGLGPQGQGEPT